MKCIIENFFLCCMQEKDNQEQKSGIKCLNFYRKTEFSKANASLSCTTSCTWPREHNDGAAREEPLH